MTTRRNSFLISFAFLVLSIAAPNLAHAQNPVREPGGTPQDIDLAINNPDEYAWQLFLFINRQASPGSAGVADPNRAIKQSEDDKDVVWETWALASGQGTTQDKSEVYKGDGSKPVAWSALPRVSAALVAKVLSKNNTALAVIEERLGGQAVLPAFSPVDVVSGDFEVRMNQTTFEHISSNELYNVEGLEAQRCRRGVGRN